MNVRNRVDKRFTTLTKAMYFDRLSINSLTDLNTKLLKTVTGNVLKTIGDRKFSFEMANVVYGGGEVVVFLIAG